MMDAPPLTSWQRTHPRVAGQRRDNLLSPGAQVPSSGPLFAEDHRGCYKLLTAEVGEGRIRKRELKIWRKALVFVYELEFAGNLEGTVTQL